MAVIALRFVGILCTESGYHVSLEPLQCTIGHIERLNVDIFSFLSKECVVGVK